MRPKNQPNKKPTPNTGIFSNEENMVVQYGKILMSIHAVECNEEAIVRKMMEVISSIIKVEFLGIVYRDFTKKSYFIVTNKGLHKPLDPLGICVLGAGIVRTCIKAGKAIHIQNYDQKHVLYSKFETSIGFNAPDALCVPILIDTVAVGTILIGLGAHYTKAPPVDHESLVHLVALNAGIALDRCYENHMSNIFLQIALNRMTDEPFTQVVNTFIEYIEKLTDSETASIYFCDHTRHEIWYVSTTKGFHGTYGKGVVGQVALTTKPVRINKCPTIQKHDVYEGHVDSVLCVPVFGIGNEESKAIAILQAINKQYHSHFSLKDEAVLIKLATEVSKTFQKRILDVRSYSLTNRQKQEYLEEGFLREFGVGHHKSSFRMRDRADTLSSIDDENSLNNSLSLSLNGSMSPRSRIVSMRSRHSSNTYTSPINHWSMNPFEYSEERLIDYSIEMFEALGLVEQFSLSVPTLRNFLHSVRRSYHGNAFHNFHHAFSVTHLTFTILTHGGETLLQPIDHLGLMISALCHDLDHPGNTNLFEIKNKSAWALLHSYESVLEKHHASETHRLLNQTESNFLITLDASDRMWLTSLLTKAILGTDMASHRQQLEAIQLRVAKEEAFIADNSNDRRTLVSFFLHCAGEQSCSSL